MKPARPLDALVHRLVVGVLAAALIVGGAPGPVLAQEPVDAYQESLDRLELFLDTLRETRDALDPSRYDLDALALELAFEDAETITREVHDRIRFEPYRGVLRGASGTLAGGAGNAADQAVLLATLLGDAGYQVEIRRVSLDDARAAQVLDQVRAAEAPEPPAPDVGAILPSFGPEEVASLAERAQDILDDLAAEAGAVEARLVERAGFGEVAGPDLLGVARDYLWVAYRLSSDADWSDAHPVFGTTPPTFEGLAAEETFEDAIPTELQHRVRLQAFVERKLGDELEVMPIMAPWERPTANLNGVPSTFAIMSDALEDVDDPSDAAALADATGFLFPTFGGRLADGAMGFDLDGNVAPPDAAASSMAGVFQAVGGAVSDAAGMLGGLGGDEEPQAAQALTGAWLEVTVVAPGGSERVHRRTILDRIGAERRAAGEVDPDPSSSEADAIAALVGAHTVIVDGARFAEAYVVDRSVAAVEASADYLRDVVEAIVEGRRPPAVDPSAAAGEEVLAPLQLLQLFDAAPTPAGRVGYRPAPGVVILSQRGDGSHAQVDIVANPRWTLALGEDGPTIDRRTSLAAGVWETRVETVPLAQRGTPRSPAFEAAASGSLRLLVDEGDLSGVTGLDAAARAAVGDDLARGYRVLLPDDASLAEAGWWRIDPATGETLGRGGDGRGQAFVEYLTNFYTSLAITAGFTVYGVHSCTEMEDATEAGCCIVQNVVLAGAGVAAGVGLGIALGAGRALVIFGAMDVGYNVGGLFLPTLCPV
jgi:hypothetical protein